MKTGRFKYLKNNYTWIISTIIVFVFFVLFIILHGIMPFGDCSFLTHDGLQQVYPFMCVLYDKIHSGDSLYYYWNSGLGGNFLSTFFFYLASPINIFLLFIDKSDILSFITFSIIIRISISAGTFSLYLLKKYDNSENKIIIIPLSCAYALSNFMLAYYHESMWLDSFMLFPIIMLGYDRLIKYHKPVLYTVSLAFAAYLNFYIVYIIGFFLCLWFLLDEHNSIKKFFKQCIWFGGFSLLAIGMAALPLIVSYLGVQTTHVSEESILSHEWYGSIFEVLRYHFMFSKLQSIGTELNYSNIYSGTFTIVLAFLYVFIKDIPLRRRIKRVSLLVFMIISMDESVLNYVWHAFHEPIFIPNRFGFVYIFVLLDLSKEAYDNLCRENGKRIIIGMILSAIFPMICYAFGNFDSNIISSQVLMVSIILISLYGIFMMCLSSKIKLKNILHVLLPIIMVCELIVNAGYSLNIEIKRKDYVNYIEQYRGLVEKIEVNEHAPFYRSEFLNNEVLNINSVYGVNGVSIFSSLIPYMTFVFSSYSGIVSGDNAIASYGLSELMESVLAEKYIYVSKDSDFYHERENYRKVDENEYVNVYENTDALSLGFGIKKDIQRFEFLYDEPFYFENELAVLMTLNEGVFDDYVPEYTINVNGKESKVSDTRYVEQKIDFSIPDSRDTSFSFDIENEGEYYICINVDVENRVVVKKNDKVFRTFDENPAGDIFYIGECNKSDKIEVVMSVLYDDEYETLDGETIGFRTAKFDKNAYKKFIDLVAKNQMTIDSMNSSKIQAHVNLEQDQLLFTSIPFDKGWHVYEDGKELKIVPIAESFIGLDLGEGYHEIEFIYMPPGLGIGMVIMLLSWIVFIAIVLLLRYKKQRIEDCNKHNDSEFASEN